MKYSHIFLSDTAYEGLCKQARNTQFIRGVFARGLGYYMSALLDINSTPEQWRDNRPWHLTATDIDNLESGETPMWDNGERKWVRNISFKSPIDRSALLAFELGVVKSNSPNMKGHGALMHSSLVNSFWEAVGLGWLVPTALPRPAYNNKYKPTPNREGMNW
jgi:hypothetical protein